MNTHPLEESYALTTFHVENSSQKKFYIYPLPLIRPPSIYIREEVTPYQDPGRIWAVGAIPTCYSHYKVRATPLNTAIKSYGTAN